ncbi:MAG: carboxypeptidase-like regulatory domain-containing protein [Bacteroidetes bacterium]|nr:carboxypeptidase-like regulatory domain-containing protein [Bacteroidota bacterium]
MRILFIALVFVETFCFSQTKSQNTIQGKLIDSLTHQPVAFANLTLSDGRTGTMTEIEGNFMLKIPSGYTGLVYISHISYQRLEVSIAYLQSHAVIALRPSSTQLQELTITATELENPAFAIIRKAVAHKKEHDPLNLKSYRYISYNKFLITMSEPSKRADSTVKALRSRPDSVKLKKNQKNFLSFDSLLQTTHLFLSESVTEKQVINPDKEKEKLLALQVSGFKSPLFTNVATDYQPFSFYNDHISLLGKDFINPVSRGTFGRYDFQLYDTSYLNQDTVFIIHFRPKSKTFFNGLKGVISICTDGYAIKNVIAASADSLMQTTIRIQQNYDKIDDHWFPVQLNTDLDFVNNKFFGRHMIAQHRSYLKEIEINPALNRRTFGDISTELSLPKKEVNTMTLERFRNSTLDKKETRTYVLIDSSMRKFRWLDKTINALATQAVPLGILELDLTKISRVNNYENVRLGAGLYTSNRFSKWLRLGGYAGYGFRDEQWKYGGEVKFTFDPNKDFHVGFSYAKDIYETGSSHLQREGQLIGNESFRTWIGSQFDKQETYKGEFGYRVMPDVHASFFLSRNEIQPTYSYQLQLGNELLNRFTISEAGFTLRYVRRENYMSLGGKKVFLGQQFPVFTIGFAQAISAFDAQPFTYTRFDITAKDQIKHRYGGKTNFFFAAGVVNGLAPYGRLYNGRGAGSSNMFIDGYFQTMGLYEFTATKYASVLLKHNVGNILLNKKFTKPELVLYQHMGVGQLDHKDQHVGLALQSFEKGFFESGVGLNNLLRGNYAKVAYWGFGGGVFYRYGEYRFANASDNVFWKATFSLGF